MLSFSFNQILQDLELYCFMAQSYKAGNNSRSKVH